MDTQSFIKTGCNMQRKLILIAWAVVMVQFSSAQFQAQLVNRFSGSERLYTVYSDLTQYRYEFEEDGMKGIVIVKPALNETAVLVPEKKFVHRTTCDGMMSRMNDPVQSYEAYKQYGPEKTIGPEKMSGYDCIKKEVYQGETPVFTAWYAEKLKFPVKIVAHQSENMFMELRDIRKWNTDPALFDVPEDYMEVDERMRPIIPEPPPPDSWTETEVSVPFEGSIKRGEKIRMTIPETVYYKFRVSNNGDTPAKFTYHLFENGKKLPWDVVGNDDRRTHRLFMGEKNNQTFDWKAGWILVVEVYEGVLELKIFPE
jgi:hypothetical protein